MKKYIFLLLLLPLVVSAHGAVTTLTQSSGTNIVEFEYNTMGSIMVGEFTIYDVYLLDANRKPIEYDTAYIKITRANGSNVLFGNIQASPTTPGYANLGGIMPESGKYSAMAQFTKDGKVVGSGNFSFDVIDARTITAKGNSWLPLATVAIVALILGTVISNIIPPRKQNANR